MIARKTVCAVILGLGFICTWPSGASGQNFIGDALGQLIGPAVGPVLERAAGEVVLEGLQRGYESGRLFPGRRRGGVSPLPMPRPRPRPSPQPVYPQPVYPQPTYPSNPSPQPYIPSQSVPSVQPIQSVPSQSVPVQPIAPKQNSLVPPANTIVARPSVEPNAAALDISLAHVVSMGSEFVWRVIKIEADQIQGQLDASLMQLIEAADEGSELAAMREPFRKFLASPETTTKRAELLQAFPQVTGVANAADAAEQLRLLPESSDQETLVQHIDTFRNSLAGLRSNVMRGEELSVLAERAKNLKNTAVLGEIARVMGIQRRDDLFVRVGSAIEKSGAPSEFGYGLLGVVLGDPDDAVGNMDLPPGNPSVVLYNPQDNPSPISFVCDGSLQLTLAPGELAPFDQSFIVSFQNGAGALKRYTIKEGLFRWAVADESGKQAWDVRQKQNVRLTIDTTGCPVEFNYLLNGEPRVAAPAAADELELAVPPRLDYHNGTGEDSTTSTLLTPGRYVVAVNPDSGGWELHQEPQLDSTMTVATLARQLWSESSRRAIASFDQGPVDAKVDALLDAIE